MKRNFYLLLIACVSVFFNSCKQDDPEPLKAQVNAELLAGAKGSSKLWKLTLIMYSEGNDPEAPVNLAACYLDNVYEFTNNDEQSYKATEGGTKCNTADSEIIEAGHWAFTLDGKILIVLPNESSYSNNVLFSVLTYPSEVLELTEIKLKIKMNLVDAVNPSSRTLTFEKI